MPLMHETIIQNFGLIPFRRIGNEPNALHRLGIIAESFNRLKIYDYEEFNGAFDRIKDAHLALSENGEIKPYQNAKIYTKTVWPTDVQPSSFYVLIPRLILLDYLASKLEKQGIDMFDLPGIVYYEIDEILYAIMPSLVEKYTETHPYHKGVTVSALQDGIHRMTKSKMFNRPQKVIIFEDSTPEILPHQVPNPNGWSDLKYTFKIPYPWKKKIYRWMTKQNMQSPTQYIKDIRPFRAMLKYQEAQWGDLPRKDILFTSK